MARVITDRRTEDRFFFFFFFFRFFDFGPFHRQGSNLRGSRLRQALYYEGWGRGAEEWLGEEEVGRGFRSAHQKPEK